jgi:hypothetical protein
MFYNVSFMKMDIAKTPELYDTSKEIYDSRNILILKTIYQMKTYQVR